MSKIITTFFLVIYTWVCQSQSKPPILSLGKSNITTIEINDELKSVEFLTDMFSTVKVVQLESKIDAYMKSMRSIRLRNDSIYIFADKKVLVFDKQGKYLATIGTPGVGPGELILPMDFTLPKNSEEVQIWDNRRRCIMFYKSDASFIRLKSIPLRYVSHVQWISNDNYLLFCYLPQISEESYSVYQYNLNDNSYEGLLPMPETKKAMSIMDHNYVSYFNENVYVRVPLNNIICLFEKGRLQPAYNLVFKSTNNLNKRMGQTNDIKELNEYLINNAAPIVTMFKELEVYYYLVYRKGTETYAHIVNKQTGEQKRIVRNNTDDILGKTIPIVSNDEYLIGVIEPSLLLARYKLSYTRQREIFKTSPWSEPYNNIKPEDNTMLIFYEIK